MDLHQIYIKVDLTRARDVISDIVKIPEVVECSILQQNCQGDDYVRVLLSTSDMKILEKINKVKGVEGFKSGESADMFNLTKVIG